MFYDTPFAEALPPRAFLQRLHRRYPQWQKDADHEQVVRAVYDNHHKLIQQKDGCLELYALDRDPMEDENIAETQADQCAKLHHILARFLEQIKSISPGIQRESTDDEVLKRLRDLGYVD